MLMCENKKDLTLESAGMSTNLAELFIAESTRDKFRSISFIEKKYIASQS